jgi:hypothetical protein
LEIISSVDSIDIYSVLLYTAICISLAWFLLRLTGKLNWAFTTVLPKALEFRAALIELNVHEPFDQVGFVRKHELPVFIACTPFHMDEREKTNVEAHLYVFGNIPAMSARDIFERNIGKRTLCLDAEDYETIFQKTRSRMTIGPIYSLRRRYDSLPQMQGRFPHC